MNRFQFVADHQQRYGVKRLCQLVGVARSSFYYWKATAPDRAARDAADAALAVRIRAVQTVNDGTYGAPRITAELHDEGLAVNHKKVARVMRRHRIRGLRLRRRVQTTIPDPAATKASDLIRRDFTAPAVNQRYVGDITYLPVGERGFLYLATVIDLHSRRSLRPAPILVPTSRCCIDPLNLSNTRPGPSPTTAAGPGFDNR